MSSEFVFVTPAYNCQDTIGQTIRSVFSQSYDKWRMVVYDDMSTDQTAQVVEDMSRSLNLGDQLRVVSRSEKYGEVRNTLDAVESVEDREIVCRLDAGDWLTDNDSLYILDMAYNQFDPAVAWSMHRWAYTSQNISGPYDHTVKNVYKHPWVSSHLKTFRRSAMRGIDRRNYLDQDGNFIMIACDQAVFLPMMQKALDEGRNLAFIPVVMYHYDIDLSNPSLFSSQRSLDQKASGEWIRERGYVQ